MSFASFSAFVPLGSLWPSSTSSAQCLDIEVGIYTWASLSRPSTRHGGGLAKWVLSACREERGEGRGGIITVHWTLYRVCYAVCDTSYSVYLYLSPTAAQISSSAQSLDRKVGILVPIYWTHITAKQAGGWVLLFCSLYSVCCNISHT